MDALLEDADDFSLDVVFADESYFFFIELKAFVQIDGGVVEGSDSFAVLDCGEETFVGGDYFLDLFFV